MRLNQSLRPLVAIAIATGIVAGCATVEPNPQLVALEDRYQQLSTKPSAQREASQALDNARSAIDDGKTAHSKGQVSRVDHNLTVAETYLDVVDARLELYDVNQELDSASERRQALLLAAREADLDQATRRARRAEAEANMTAEELERRKMEVARQEQALAAQQQQLAQQQADLESAEAAAIALAEQVQELQAEMSERGMVLTLSDIVFDFDSANLQPGSKRPLDKLATFLGEHEKRHILIEGFTDSVGGDDYNEQLSLRRAEAVQQALVEKGTNLARIQVRGYGEQYPVADNTTAEGRQQNRRVEVIIGNQDGARPDNR